MKHRVSQTIHEAYEKALYDVWYEYEYKSAPRGQAVREILDYAFTVLNPTSDAIITQDKDRNKIIIDYTTKETDLYNSGTNSVEDFAKASKFWNQLANPDNTVNSAYGHLIWYKRSHGNPVYELGENTDIGFRTPWEWAKQSLIADKDTRQAVLRFSLPEHFWIGNKDQVCTLHGNFLIRDDKLHLSITMRSNDLMKGLVYDLPWFISLIDKMIEELRPTYPSLEKGTYTHLSHSMHIYEKDKDSILRMLNENLGSNS
jgi:thymidylate synthase